MLASETVRHLAKAKNLKLFDDWISDAINQVSAKGLRLKLQNIWAQLNSKLAAGTTSHGLMAALGMGRQIMFTIAWLVCGTLLALDAQRDNDEVASEVARRWVIDGQGVPGEFAFSDLIYQRSALYEETMPTDKERTEWDSRIVWGVGLPATASTGYRASKI